MKKSTLIAAISALLACAALSSFALLPASQPTPSATFSVLRLHLQVDLPSAGGSSNSVADQRLDLLDLPAALKLELEASSALRGLQLINPQGKSVFALSYSRGGGMVGSEVVLQCKGSSLREVLARYPAGTYLVEGRTMDGRRVGGSVCLSAGFPEPFVAGFRGGSASVQTSDAQLAWGKSRSAAGYQLEIESPPLGTKFSVRLPSGAAGFLIPVQLLVPGTPYEYSLKVQGDNDNELEFEGSFSTAP